MKAIIMAIVAAAAIIGGAVMMTSIPSDSGSEGDASRQNVSIVDGVQVIEIDAKGGYFPKKTIAQAGIPSVIKMKTSGTFDCSSALTIPSLNYRANLPPNGQTVIEVPAQEAGASMRGLCSMGMYNFVVSFE